MRLLLAGMAVGLTAMHCAGSDALYDPPGGKGFWARRSDISSGDSSFYRVTAMFAGSSNNAQVYTEAKRSVPKSSIDGLLSAFENNVVPVEHLWYTTPTDVDDNGKVILLLLDIQDGYQPGGGYIAGYFDPINHYSEVSVNTANDKYHSNHAEMLYLDTYPADVTKTSFFATLAHEYQHLLQFGKYYRGDQDDVEPPWVDEGLAEVSSDLTGFGPQTGRANNFRSALLNGTSLIKEPSAFLLDNYASSYIYFRYLADVYGLGGIAAIFNNNKLGVEGVNSALQGVDTSLAANCGNSAGLTYVHFSCSYRFMWAAMVAGNLGDTPTTVTVHFNGAADMPLSGTGSYSYQLRTANSTYTQELANSLQNGSYAAIVNTTVASGALQSHAPKLFKVNSGGMATNLASCSNCGLTMIVGANYHVVYNHDVTTTTTHAAGISDNMALGQIVEDTSAALPAEPPAVGTAPLENRKLHWHFPLNAEFREFLQQQ